MKQGHPSPAGHAPALPRLRWATFALHVLSALPLCLLLSCDQVERNWSTCSDKAPCAAGFTCNHDYRCVPDVNAGRNASLDGSTDHPADATPSLDTAAAPIIPDAPLATDAPVPDAALPPDTAPPDTRPVQCTSSAQCPTTAPICTANLCAACTAGSQCLAMDPGTPICATAGAAAGQCVECADDSSCKGLAGTPACDTTKNRCVECTSAANCLGAARACDHRVSILRRLRSPTGD